MPDSLEELVRKFRWRVVAISRAEKRIQNQRVEAGKLLLEMRRRVEGGEVGKTTWWAWYEANAGYSRKTGEELMRWASSENPTEAHETQKTKMRKALRDLRAMVPDNDESIDEQPEISSENLYPAVTNIDVTAVQSEVIQPEVIEPTLKKRPGRPKGSKNKPAKDEQVAQILSLIEQLSHDQRQLLLAEIRNRYGEVNQTHEQTSEGGEDLSECHSTRH